MAHVNDCVPGREARILRAGVPRVVGKAGVIVEVKRVKATGEQAVVDYVTVDVRGHGPVVVAPDEIDIIAS